MVHKSVLRLGIQSEIDSGHVYAKAVPKRRIFMTAKLKDYFPLIRERDEVLAEIRKSRTLHRQFRDWTKQQQEEFLDICTGVKGLKLLYDGFFKEVMNPEYGPERLSDFLSCLLGQELKVVAAIPSDSARLADESVLLGMDIVVALADGSIANVEMQRIGYLFPGQRGACYSADLLLRQYKRVRGRKENFSYRDVKSVYTIVLFEKSPAAFHAYPDIWYHFFRQKSDTGLELELLQKYLFIPLDIFTKNRQNRNIRSKRDAWLTLFSSDDPETVMELIEAYPEFKEIYEEGYEICRNMEKVMGLFSKELYLLDRNTEKLMFDEMQKESEELRIKSEEMRRENEKMRLKNDIMQQENQKMRLENDVMQQENQKMRLENDVMQQENQKIHMEKDVMQRENEELKREKEMLVKELEKLRREQDALKNGKQN